MNSPTITGGKVGIEGSVKTPNGVDGGGSVEQTASGCAQELQTSREQLPDACPAVAAGRSAPEAGSAGGGPPLGLPFPFPLPALGAAPRRRFPA